MKSHAQPAALVLNCHYNGLALIQALGRRGLPVLAVDSKRTIGTRSRYCRYVHVPDPGGDRAGFVEALMDLGSRFAEKPLVIPTNDHWAEALAWGATRLADHYRLCVANIDTVKLLLDKEHFGRWASDNGIQAPAVWSAKEALARREELPYPVAVKANARRRSGQAADARDWARKADSLRFVVCADAASLGEVLGRAESAGVRVFCQQIVNGRSDAMRTIGVYAREGRGLGMIYGRKARGFPARYGDCIVGIAEPVPDWARNLAVKCCDLLGYTGIAELEVMVDSETGERYLIEINPRSWSWVGIGPVAGADLAWIAYQDMVQGVQPERTIEGCADGQPVYYAKALADFQNTLLWYRFSGAPDWSMSPWAWWRTFRGGKGVFAEFSGDDPAVTFFSLVASTRQFSAHAYKLLRGARFE